MVGSGATGKTCLLNVLKCGRFPDMFEPTVFESFTVTFDVDNVQVLCIANFERLLLYKQ